VSYTVRLSRQAKRALTTDLPEVVAVACFEFIYGSLADNPHRVGKQLDEPLWPSFSARRGQFRIIYDIHESEIVVSVINIRHRADAYRSH